MPTSSHAVFHHRPMLYLGLGLCAGLVMNGLISGTARLMAMCLFTALFGAGIRFGFKGQAIFCLGMVIGIIRAMFSPIYLPAGLIAPFQYTRYNLLTATKDLFGDQAPILQAMLWGDKADITDALYSAYRDSGIAHVLALSGLHVSFIAAIIVRLTRKCRPQVRFFAAAPLLFSYCAIAAFPASLVRAAVMSLCALYAGVCGRRYDMLSGMAFSAIIILLFDPSNIYDIGFQLSFAAVLTIALLMKKLSGILDFLPEDIADAAALSLCGSLGTLPLSIYHFGKVPALGLFANLLILPIVPFVFISALAVCVIGVFLPGVGMALAPLPVFLTKVMTAAASAIASLDIAIRSDGISALACLFIYLGYAALSDQPLVEDKYKYLSAAAMFAGAALCMI